MTVVDKVWFVTGASRRFSRIWAEAALERGDRVAAAARDAAALGELEAAYSDAVLALPLDVTDRDVVFAAVVRARKRFGRLDLVVTAAGYAYLGAVEEFAPAEVRANVETNLFGTLWVVQAELPILRA